MYRLVRMCLSLLTYVGPAKALTTSETPKLASHPSKPELREGNNKEATSYPPQSLLYPQSPLSVDKSL